MRYQAINSKTKSLITLDINDSILDSYIIYIQFLDMLLVS